MTLRFKYRPFRVSRPQVSLAGRTVRPRPVIDVLLVGPTGSSLAGGLLDTGADDTLFPESVAREVGIDLARAPTGSGAGVGMHLVTARFVQVTLRIATNTEHREWPAWVGFTSAQLRHPMLGYAGFLQFFTAVFHGDREVVELTINSTYPGT